MATRLYGVATTAAPVSPAFDANWQSTTGAVRRSLSTTKAASTETRATVDVTSGSGNETLAFQLVSEPLNAGAITGTVTIVSRGRELATTDNIALKVHSIRVFSDDGNTLRGTSLAFANGSNTTELGTSLQGNIHTSAVSLTSVTAQTGDRIVVELGYGMNTTGTTPQYDMVIGGNGTDHTTTQGDTTGTVPWIEFSQNLSFIDPITALSDDFNDNSTDTGKWGTGGTVSETGGQLVCTPIVDGIGWDYSRYESVRGYSLVGRALVVQVPQVLNDTGGTDETMLAFGNGVDDYLAIFKTGTSLVFRDKSEVTASDTSVTYSPTDHAWWRIRESGGTVFFDTSPDGVTWTNQRSRVPTDPDFLNAALVRIQAGQWSAGGTPGTAIFDNLNGIPTQSAAGTGVAAAPVAAVGGNAEQASATGTGLDATVTVPAAAAPDAGTTSATGTGQDPAAAITANAEQTAATATAADATVAATVPAELTSATGTGLDPAAAVAGAAELTSATGTALDPVAAVTTAAETAAGTGAGLDATVSTVTQTTAPAEPATATGAAGDATVAVTTAAETTSATGAGLDATVTTVPAATAPAEATAGIGTAQDAAITATAPAEAATGTGTGLDATVSTSSSASAAAEATSAAGVAADPAASITGQAEVSTATATAPGPAGSIEVSAQPATATATGLDATTAITVSAEPATSTGDALAPAGSGTVPAGTTSSTGAGFDATVSTLAQTSAPAEQASATGAGLDPAVAVTVPAGTTSATGTADSATGQGGRDAPAEQAAATGTALDANVAASVLADLAAAVAAALDAVALSAPEIIKGTGSVTAGRAATGSVHLDRPASSSVELVRAASSGVTID